MTAGVNWWWAYEIGCIRAGYRHWQRKATIAMTMPFDEMTEVSGSGWAELDGPGDGTVKTLGVKAPWLGRRRVDLYLQ